jgi:hypothetical protein
MSISSSEKTEETILKNILNEFNHYNVQINEVIRLQNEFTKQESELFALQIRFVHKLVEFKSHFILFLNLICYQKSRK